MRTLRTTTAAGAALLLALTTASAAVAADTEPCTGIVEFGEDGMTWTATDPRLSGDATGTGGWSFYAPAAEDAGTLGAEDRSYIIINEDGSWGCARSEPTAPEPDATGHTLVFAGTGDYEGLTAHVRIDWDTYPFSFSGIIVESGLPDDSTLAG